MNLDPGLKKGDKIFIVLSDCHLSGGRILDGSLNPYEDFHFDDDMVALFEHFSSGPYGEINGEPVEVELFLAGDYLDFLNIPYRGEFEDAVTEDIACEKLDGILAGHPAVMEALKRFASLPGKTITYLIGNHDADLAFERVRERIIRAWDPDGSYPSQKVRIIHDKSFVRLPGGVEIHHGNQFEWGSVFDFEQPTLKIRGRRILNMPWSSVYVLKIVNRLKPEREYIDKVQPARLFFLFGLLSDPWFTIRFTFLSIYYFIRTRLLKPGQIDLDWKRFRQVLKREASVTMNLESPARTLLTEDPTLKTIIMGHNHQPMNKIYSDGKQYLNTGTWTKMIHLDFRRLGLQLQRTFAYVRIRGDEADAELRQWVGETGPHKTFQG